MTRSERLAAILIALIGVLAVAMLLAPRSAARPDEKVMMVLAGQLTKLSPAVDAAVAYEDPPPGLDDAGLVEFATQHDPSLRAPFAPYLVRVLRGAGHAIVLVCEKSGGTALLEDAGCTAAHDRHRWREDGPPACAFSIDLAAACPGSGVR